MSAISTAPPEGTPRLPTSLLAHARWLRLGGDVPAMVVHPDTDHRTPVPALLWMHGRTVRKEIDPGRGLRLMRSGIALCAVDLPGHGERLDRALQQPERTLDVVTAMIDEIDDIADDLGELPGIDASRLALGGMSAGGMAALSRLCAPHDFTAVSVEATTGSWDHQRHRAMFKGRDESEWHDRNPIDHLHRWREIPFQAIHGRYDAWVGFDGQEAFVEALRARYADPGRIDFVVFERTGAPHEHAGFGSQAAVAKDRQRTFLTAALSA